MNENVPIRVRPLTSDDVDAILAFELANRTYFERSVPARPEAFFDPTWQATNLRELAEDSRGRYCLVFGPDNTIVGRLNLSFVEREDGLWGDLGYRVGQAHVGQGIATRSIQEGLKWLKDTGRFRGACASATLENVGSVRALEKTGFERVPGSARSETLGSQKIELWEFRRRFALLPACPS